MKHLTLLAGHYGSGKTNVALNLARRLRREAGSAARVTVADLDIVNPYFRTKDSAADLAAEGIDLVVSQYANSNVDFPALPKEIYALVAPEERPDYVVMDIGGDDRGALALGRYVPAIRDAGDYDLLAVLNFARPLTRTPDDALGVLAEIEAACGLPFTGLVNNTNLGPETTVDDVLAALPLAKAVAERTHLPIVFTSVRDDLASRLADRVPNLLPLNLQKLYYQLTP